MKIEKFSVSRSRDQPTVPAVSGRHQPLSLVSVSKSKLNMLHKYLYLFILSLVVMLLLEYYLIATKFKLFFTHSLFIYFLT